MPEADPFRAWLDDFERQVDAAVGRAAPPAGVQSRLAQGAFQRWWDADQRPLLAERPAAELPFELDFERRLELLNREKRTLEAELAALQRERERLQDAAAASERRSGEADAAAAQARRDAQAAAERLHAERALHEQNAQAARENREFLEKALAASQGAERSAREQLSLERERALAADAAALSAKTKLAELEQSLEAARAQLASQAGALEELRRHASTYQERLVQAKERTDQDVAGLRQELRMFQEELRIIANTIKRGA